MSIASGRASSAGRFGPWCPCLGVRPPALVREASSPRRVTLLPHIVGGLCQGQSPVPPDQRRSRSRHLRSRSRPRLLVALLHCIAAPTAFGDQPSSFCSRSPMGPPLSLAVSSPDAGRRTPSIDRCREVGSRSACLIDRRLTTFSLALQTKFFPDIRPDHYLRLSPVHMAPLDCEAPPMKESVGHTPQVGTGLPQSSPAP